MRKTSAMLIAVLAAFGLGATASPAYATGECYETVVVKDAWTETKNHPVITKQEMVTVVDKPAWTEAVFDYWQRYSWTGGPHGSDSAPSQVPPHEDWQPNVKGDPHGVGKAGPYFRSHGNSGKGDWFYLEAVTRTVHHPAETHTETRTVVVKEAWVETIKHPAITEKREVPCSEEPEGPGLPEEPEQPGPEKPEKPDTTPREAPSPPSVAPTVKPAAVPTAVASGVGGHTDEHSSWLALLGLALVGTGASLVAARYRRGSREF